MAGALSRSMHRIHRSVGTALCVLMASWFASGAVMTFAPFPRFDERERLAHGRPLAADVRVELPPGLGPNARLVNLEGQPTWLFRGAEGRSALRAAPPFDVKPLDHARARRELERFGPLHSLELLSQSDQWSVAVALGAGTLPLYRGGLQDDGSVYLAARTGEVVQQTTPGERFWAWLGAIPHWVYFTSLRRSRLLWRYTVLVLSTLGLLVTGSGLVAGVSVWRTLRGKRGIKDRALRWHQWLGLGFGVLASSWLFSGALSLTPFQWSEATFDPAPLFAPVAHDAESVRAALRGCQARLPVHELQLVSFAGRGYALCLGTEGRSRIVDLRTQQLGESLPASMFTGLTATLPGARVSFADQPDDYFYATHGAPEFPGRYVRVALPDAERSTLYLDPARARLLALHTDRTRLERWLYNGLHSLDFAFLYRHHRIWLAVIWLAMAGGFALSGLGVLLAWRRMRRKLRKRRAGKLAGRARGDVMG